MGTESLFGMWWLPDRPEDPFPGRITWEAPRAAVLEVLEPPLWMTHGLREAIPAVCGKVSQFGFMTLLGCHRWGVTFGQTIMHRFRAGHAITGWHLAGATERWVRRIELEVPALAELLGDYPASVSTAQLGRRRTTLRVDLDDRRLRWSRDGVDVQFEYVRSTMLGRLNLQVSMLPRVALATSRSESYKWWYDEWLSPLVSFFHIATAVSPRARFVHLWSKKHITPQERGGGYASVWRAGVDPSEPDRTEVLDPRDFEPVLSAGQIKHLDIHDVVKRAKSSRDRHEVFYDLLTDAISATERPVRSRYLDVVTALEAFHAGVHSRGPIERESFRHSRRAALSAVTDVAAREFFKKWTPTDSFYTLEKRLTDIQRQTGSVWEHPASRMAALRNEIAHGNAHPDPVILRTCFRQAMGAARRVALNEMGVS